eukprot:Sdes_comp8916_c0_seq1m326
MELPSLPVYNTSESVNPLNGIQKNIVNSLENMKPHTFYSSSSSSSTDDIIDLTDTKLASVQNTRKKSPSKTSKQSSVPVIDIVDLTSEERNNTSLCTQSPPTILIESSDSPDWSSTRNRLVSSASASSSASSSASNPPPSSSVSQSFILNRLEELEQQEYQSYLANEFVDVLNFRQRLQTMLPTPRNRRNQRLNPIVSVNRNGFTNAANVDYSCQVPVISSQVLEMNKKHNLSNQAENVSNKLLTRKRKDIQESTNLPQHSTHLSTPHHDASPPLDPSTSAPASTTTSVIPQCTICLEDMKNMTSTICGHVFCYGCIKETIKTHKKCPICRKKLTMKGTHPIFM